MSSRATLGINQFFVSDSDNKQMKSFFRHKKLYSSLVSLLDKKLNKINKLLMVKQDNDPSVSVSVGVAIGLNILFICFIYLN